MVRAEGLLRDRQRALEERLGLRVLALRRVKHREVVQARGHNGMVFAVVLLCDLERLFRNDHGTVIFSFLIERHQFLIENFPLAASSVVKTRGGKSAGAAQPFQWFAPISSFLGLSFPGRSTQIVEVIGLRPVNSMTDSNFLGMSIAYLVRLLNT